MLSSNLYFLHDCKINLKKEAKTWENFVPAVEKRDPALPG